MADPNDIELSPGMRVVDATGRAIGTIRAVYPHFIAVDGEGAPNVAYRVPPHTFAGFDGATLTISVPITALDEMTPERETAEGLPHHGGALPTD